MNALVTGAGISADPPSSLPLGAQLHDRIIGFCYTAAARIAPEAVDHDGLARVRSIPRNLLRRLTVAAGTDDVNALLECFCVPLPTEGHLLAAVHGIRGALHLTLNFDDGVENAFALITGEADLPDDAPAEYHAALREWRRAVHADAPPLTAVVPGTADIDLNHRPLLVKLRGCVRTGFDPGLISGSPNGPYCDRPTFSPSQLAALVTATGSPHVVVAGVSASDRDCRDGLIPLLRQGHFIWTAAALSAEVIRLLRAIDPMQPVLRPALEGLRDSLGETFPAWPRTPMTKDGRFFDRFDAWQAQFPLEAAAATYASLLSDSGMCEQAVVIMKALPNFSYEQGRQASSPRMLATLRNRGRAL